MKVNNLHYFKNMDFKKLKELIEELPDKQLDNEVYITFISETKAGKKEVRRGDLSGVIYVDSFPLEFVVIEEYGS